MKLGILNADLGIAVVDSMDDLGDFYTELLKKQMPDGANLCDLAFFYMNDRDWIVLNKSNKRYEFYEEIIQVYLELSEEMRKKCFEEAPTGTIKNAFRILDSVIINRALIYERGVNIYDNGKTTD